LRLADRQRTPFVVDTLSPDPAPIDNVVGGDHGAPEAAVVVGKVP
jgi:hypothetical protein